MPRLGAQAAGAVSYLVRDRKPSALPSPALDVGGGLLPQHTRADRD